MTFAETHIPTQCQCEKTLKKKCQCQTTSLSFSLSRNWRVIIRKSNSRTLDAVTCVVLRVSDLDTVLRAHDYIRNERRLNSRYAVITSPVGYIVICTPVASRIRSVSSRIDESPSHRPSHSELSLESCFNNPYAIRTTSRHKINWSVVCASP